MITSTNPSVRRYLNEGGTTVGNLFTFSFGSAAIVGDFSVDCNSFKDGVGVIAGGENEPFMSNSQTFNKAFAMYRLILKSVFFILVKEILGDGSHHNYHPHVGI